MSELWAVTGATGFIGRALRADLEKSAIAVRGLSRSAGDGKLVRGDVRDIAAVSQFVDGADVVVHLAAWVHKRSRTSEEMRECWSVNVEGTETVINAAAKNDKAFLILISSANVYAVSEGPAGESTFCQPRTHYGRSKQEAERRLLDAIQKGRVRGCILRPAIVFGPGAPGNLRRLLQMVRSGIVFEISHGAQRKSLVPISALTCSIRTIASRRDSCNGQIFNVSAGVMTIHEIIQTLAQALEVRPRIISVPMALARVARAAAALVAPGLANTLETYAVSSVLETQKLQHLLEGACPSDVRAALTQTARSAI